MKCSGALGRGRFGIAGGFPSVAMFLAETCPPPECSDWYKIRGAADPQGLQKGGRLLRRHGEC